MKKWKKLAVCALSVAMALSLFTGCGSEEVVSSRPMNQTADEYGYTEDATQGDTERETKDNDIPDSTKSGAGWVIFVYMCGSDLESKGGAASFDMKEMLENSDDNVTYVVETGGAKSWNTREVDKSKIQRFEIKNGNIKEVFSKKTANMGDEKEFEEFVAWGEENYDAAHKAMVLWNHGSGSILGVCFDELHNYDSLTLEEIDEAFSGALKTKYDFVGYDACLMATIENATMLASYADYMIASQELESGAGWNYEAINKCINRNPSADAKELGKAICDGMYEACEQYGVDDMATLSLVDLSKIESVNRALEVTAGDMNECSKMTSRLNVISKGILGAENYGGNSRTEGYTNMVDLADICDNISSVVSSAKDLKKEIQSAVVYNVTGMDRSNSNGLSIYYPLSVQGSKEMKTFENLCASANYVKFVNMMLYGADNGNLDDYDYSEDDYDWSEADRDEEDTVIGSSESVVQIKQDMFLDEDNYYNIVLDTNQFDYVNSVQNMLFADWYDDGYLYYLGNDNNVYIDVDTGLVTDNFEAVWPALPDGQLLMFYIVEETEEYTLYTAPIKLNGEDTNLRFVYRYDDNEYHVIGAWDGIDEETGVTARDYIEIKAGDVIVPYYVAIDIEGDDNQEQLGVEYTVGKKFIIEDYTLPEGDYYYIFEISDIFGNSTYSDLGKYYVDENGGIFVD